MISWIKNLIDSFRPLTEREKDGLINRIKSETRPGAIIEVTSKELTWMSSPEYAWRLDHPFTRFIPVVKQQGEASK